MSTVKKALTALTTILLTSPAYADVLSVHCPLGCPSSPGSNDLVFTHTYALSNNPVTKFADWVAYEVDVTNFGESPGRNWKSDPLLDESETLEEADYKGASKALNVDRGHLAPLASFAGSKYWYELNHLSNITPQAKDLNQGPWRLLEESVRSAARYRDSLYVITGPFYTPPTKKLPEADEDHSIPSGYFKIIYDSKGNYAAFLMNQDIARNTPFCSTKTTLGKVSERTSIVVPQLKSTRHVLQRLGC